MIGIKLILQNQHKFKMPGHFILRLCLRV